MALIFIALVVALIVQSGRVNKYRDICKRYERLLDEKNSNAAKTQSDNSAAVHQNALQNTSAAQQYDLSFLFSQANGVSSASTEVREAVPETVPEQTSEAVSEAAENSVAEAASEVVSKAAEKPVSPVTEPAAEKRGRVSSMNIMLILGALLIIISGLIFATTAWRFLSGGVRAVVILSFSAIFFGVSALAERKLKLEKTGLLFYTLGSVFLPITIIAAGFFGAFGEWFSLHGEGRPLLLAATFAAFSAVCIRGSRKYGHAAFSWAGLVSMSAAVCSLILQFTHNAAYFALAASVYGLAVIFAGERLSKLRSEKFAPLLSQLNVFAAVNTVCLSVSSIAAAGMDGSGVVTLASCALFATGYLKCCFTEKNGFGGAIPFALFVTFGMFSAFSPVGFDGVTNTLAAASAVPAVLSFMNIFPDKLKGALKYVSGIFAAAALLLCGIAAFTTEPSAVSLAAYAVLTGEILALGLIHRSEKSGAVMLHIFPAACVIVCEMLSKLVFTEFYLGRYILFLVLAASLQAAFVLIKSLPLRTVTSDIIFAFFGFAFGFYALLWDFSMYGVPTTALFCAAVFFMSEAAVILPALTSESGLRRTAFSAVAAIWGGCGLTLALLPILPSDYGAMVIAAGVLSAVSLLITFKCGDKSLDKAVSIAARAVTGLYAIISLITGEPSAVLFAMAAAVSVIRLAKYGASSEFYVSAAAIVVGFLAYLADPFQGSFGFFASVGTYLAMTAAIFVCGFIKRGKQESVQLFRLLPMGLAAAAVMLADGRYVLLAVIIAALQALFVFSKKLAVRTSFSDFIFAGTAVMAETICSGAFSVGYDTSSLKILLLLTGAFLLTAATVALPAAVSDGGKGQTVLAGAAFLWGGFGVFPIYDLFGYFASDSAAIISAVIAAAALIVSSLAVMYKSDKKSLDLTASVITRVVAGAYIIWLMTEGAVISPIFALLAVMSALRYAKQKSVPELVSALLLFIATAGTAAADIFDIGFKQALLFMCGAAAAEWVCVLFINGGEKKSAAEAVSRYALGVLNCLCLLYLSAGEGSPAYIALTVMFLLLAVTAFYSAKTSAFLVAPLVCVYFAVSVQTEYYARELLFDGSYREYLSYSSEVMFNPVNTAILILIGISIAMSYILHRNEIGFKSEKGRYLDMFALTRFFGVIFYFDASESEEARWLTILLLGACLLTMCRKNQPAPIKRWIYTVCAVAPVIAWISQPFFTVPEIIALELDILPILLYCFALKLLWKDRLTVIDNITFAVYTLSYIVLFFDAVSSGEVADGLIIAVSALAVLIFSFTVKKKKWFLLSVAVIVISALFMSRDFWTSLAWWVYLLAAGLILIAIGAANEMKKQAAAKNEKSELEKKITRFMSEWTW